MHSRWCTPHRAGGGRYRAVVHAVEGDPLPPNRGCPTLANKWDARQMRQERYLNGTLTLECSACRRYFPPEAFNRHAAMRHGRASWCRSCQATATRHWRADNADALNAARRVHYPDRECPSCGTTFTPKRSDSRYCCTDCGHHSRVFGAYRTAEGRAAHQARHLRMAGAGKLVTGMTPEDARRWSACLHEASHAAVAVAQGTRLRQIVVRPVALGLAGFVSREPRTDLSPLEDAIVGLTTIEAGNIGAEALWSDPPARVTDEAGLNAQTSRLVEALPEMDRGYVRSELSGATTADGTDDEARSASIANEVAPGEAVWLLALARARAQRLIREYAVPILALAAELWRRPILDGPTAEAIIEAARTGPASPEGSVQ